MKVKIHEDLRIWDRRGSITIQSVLRLSYELGYRVQFTAWQEFRDSNFQYPKYDRGLDPR